MTRRVTVIAFTVAALTGCTGSMEAAPVYHRTVPQVTVETAPVPLDVGQEQHSAFPGLARLPNGELHLVWRQGSDHYLARDGKLKRAVSTDGGATFGQVLTLREGADFRDPSVSVVNGAAHMTMFTGTAAAPAQGAYSVREWGLYSRIDQLPYAAITAPLVRLPDGRLGAAFYGRKAGEGIDTAWMGWSSDEGRTWSTNRIANGIGAGLSHAEPWLVVDGSLTHLFFRWGDTGIGMRTSTDSGATAAGWGPVRQILSNATGRPTVIATQTGALVMVYRALPSKDAAMVYSLDHGATWQSGGTVLAAPAGSPHGMTYAAMVETAPGRIRLVVGLETATSASTLYSGTLVTSPAVPR